MGQAEGTAQPAPWAWTVQAERGSNPCPNQMDHPRGRQPRRPLTRTARRRVLHRAIAAWRDSKPHQAWTILAEAGMKEYWPPFQRAMLRDARDRFEAAMP